MVHFVLVVLYLCFVSTAAKQRAGKRACKMFSSMLRLLSLGNNSFISSTCDVLLTVPVCHF